MFGAISNKELELIDNYFNQVFDALGSNRCYKKAWKDEDIFTLLENEKAKHFDPKLIYFLKI